MLCHFMARLCKIIRTSCINLHMRSFMQLYALVCKFMQPLSKFVPPPQMRIPPTGGPREWPRGGLDGLGYLSMGLLRYKI